MAQPSTRPLVVDDLEKALELWRLASASPGMAVRVNVQTVIRSRHLFVGNAAELHGWIDRYQREFEPGKPEYLDVTPMLDHVDRLMHNFVAASYTLSSHTTKARDALGEAAFMADYDAASPFGEPACQIIKLVRNDVQHAHLAGVEAKMTMVLGREPPVEFRFRLVRGYLRTLKFNTVTRVYLESSGDPALDELIETYTHHVDGFVAWFVTAISEHAVVALDQTKFLLAESQRLAPMELQLTINGRMPVDPRDYLRPPPSEAEPPVA
jgi:hypothetical protein